jgi:small-conductance mechanosensitive channel
MTVPVASTVTDRSANVNETVTVERSVFVPVVVAIASSAAGVYLLLNQPYGIGDEIEIDGHRGIVQEVDVVATLIENDSEEFLVPNYRVLQSGIVRVRD